jgi:hypothetical protein
MLKANLKDDQKRYRGPSSGPTQLPPKIQLPDWQKDHAKAVNDMSNYVVDTTMEEDVDLEEGGDDGGNGSSDGPQDLEMEDREFVDDDGDSTGPGPMRMRPNPSICNLPPRGNEQLTPIGRELNL